MEDNYNFTHIVNETLNPNGFIIHKERYYYNYDDTESTLQFVDTERAYTPEGMYIGDVATAEMVYSKNIKPEYITPESKICRIGFCEKEQQWYGWSHRAIYGFGIGSEIKKGDIAYVPKNKYDFLDNCVAFWSDFEFKKDIKGRFDINRYCTVDLQTNEIILEELVAGVRVIWTYKSTVPNTKLSGTQSDSFAAFPDEYGKGEWKATTLEEARQMAIDFSDNVS